MYAVAALEPGGHWLSLKRSPEDFAALIERPGIIPAPYLARAHWVALETPAALPLAELENFLALDRDLVFATLSKKQQSALKHRTPTAPPQIKRQKMSAPTADEKIAD